jgi:hypothetical protein
MANVSGQIYYIWKSTVFPYYGRIQTVIYGDHTDTVRMITDRILYEFGAYTVRYGTRIRTAVIRIVRYGCGALSLEHTFPLFPRAPLNTREVNAQAPRSPPIDLR